MQHIAAIEAMKDELIAFRRDLHAHPELGHSEFRTAEKIASALDELGIEVHRNVAGTGVIGVIKGKRPGKVVALRADMDALAMTEAVGDRPWRSTDSSCMHGCGHDGHATMLMGAARYLVQHRDFAGTVVLIFQHAEEGNGGSGAREMVEDGVLDRFNIAEIYGMHNWPGLPSGTFGMTPNAIMASGDLLTIEVSGRGGHGAMPHRAVDPILVAAHLVSALQSVVARNIDPLESAVLTIGSIHGGDAANVIPGEVHLKGTFRALSPDVREQVINAVQRLCEGIALAHGARIEMKLGGQGVPATINTPSCAETCREAAASLLGMDGVEWGVRPSMAGEDFAYFLQQRPGCMVWIGNGMDSLSLHHPEYDFNDEILTVGASYWVRLAEGALSQA